MKRRAEDSISPRITLVELAVVLATENFDSSIITADFLCHSGIVRDNPKTIQPPVSTPIFAHVSFEGGLEVNVRPDQLAFIHRLDEGKNSPRAGMIVEMVVRFLEKVPFPRYLAIGINPRGFSAPIGKTDSRIANTLIDGGTWMAFDNANPVVSLKSVYSLGDRRITMFVDDHMEMESKKLEASSLEFYANIHREITEDNHSRRISLMTSILSKWEDDLKDFEQLVEQFNAKGILA